MLEHVSQPRQYTIPDVAYSGEVLTIWLVVYVLYKLSATTQKLSPFSCFTGPKRHHVTLPAQLLQFRELPQRSDWKGAMCFWRGSYILQNKIFDANGSCLLNKQLLWRWPFRFVRCMQQCKYTGPLHDSTICVQIDKIRIESLNKPPITFVNCSKRFTCTVRLVSHFPHFSRSVWLRYKRRTMYFGTSLENT